ncbi:hypothetical protein HanPI659440_Chr06g0246791 [Helianthus annuus]|uniref:Uncharacterized protein n=1 Tax=Helianthus annuus TaxID=4232 RepID=A0A251U226_HELAN|nr:hypothetical protein HanOQP8_Chr06g0231001 [Helianthus annuus]KAJ0781218.1 hypothetical protein HanPI659440_Chr06g0246791 [Helianthus annuus]
MTQFVNMFNTKLNGNNNGAGFLRWWNSCRSSGFLIHLEYFPVDSLSYMSALSVALALVLLVIATGITIFKFIAAGSIIMPKWRWCHAATT